MAYRRAGESMVMKDGYYGFIRTLFSLLSFNANWIIFSYNEKKIDFSLLKFLFSLYLEFYKGSFSGLWIYIEK